MQSSFAGLRISFLNKSLRDIATHLATSECVAAAYPLLPPETGQPSCSATTRSNHTGTSHALFISKGYPLSSTSSREHVALDARTREAHAEVALRHERFSVPDARSKGRWAIRGLDFARGWWWS